MTFFIGFRALFNIYKRNQINLIRYSNNYNTEDVNMKEKNINFILFILGTLVPILLEVLLNNIHYTPLRMFIQYFILIVIAFLLIYIV